MQKYTREQVAKHNTEEDCFTIIHNKVYDMTEYMGKHPGGYDLMFKNAGKDSTADFEAMYHSQKARKILDDLYVGDLDDPSSATSSSMNMLTRFANRFSLFNNPASQQQQLQRLEQLKRGTATTTSEHTFVIPSSDRNSQN